MKRRGAGLFSKYFAFIGLLVSAGLVASGAIGLYFSYQETRNSLMSLQREKALTAAVRIEHFLRDIESQLGWTTLPLLIPAANAMESRRLDFLKVLRQLPAVTEVQHLDGNGREQLKVSRLAMDTLGSGADYSAEPRFIEARKGRTWFGPVYFRKETEPYMTFAIPEARDRPGVTVVDVNLKFIWDVVSRIRTGQKGIAYVVDEKGFLVAHPDISFVLRKVNLSDLPQVKAALGAGPEGEWREVAGARDSNGEAVLSAHARVPQTGWTVFVEEPESAVYAPLYGAMVRTALLLLAGVVLSIVASLALARRMVQPVRALTAGAERIGRGDLADRIEVKTGDELEDLAERFNTMTGQLRESYAGLEQKVEARTVELRESLEQQTAVADILRTISSSPTDDRPVLDAVAANARRICAADNAAVVLRRGDMVVPVAAMDRAEMQSPFALDRETVTGRAILEARTICVADLLAEDIEYPVGSAQSRVDNCRALIATPLLLEGQAIGAVCMWRRVPDAFTARQVELAETFAAQAVIAIENVRLFNEIQSRNRELGEALEQQTATADMLQVISSSPTNATPVFEAIVRVARDLGEAYHAYAFRFDGERISYVTGTDKREAWLADVATAGSWVPDRSTMTGRVVLARGTVQIEDMDSDPEYRSRTVGEERSLLGVPMLRDGLPVGVLTVTWKGAGAVPGKFVRLLETFAAQAVIAIENVRLFNELDARNRELGESLEQQTAVGEILRVISSSPTDVQPVLDAIAKNSARICGAEQAVLAMRNGDELVPRAFAAPLENLGPFPLSPATMTGRSILQRRTTAIDDLQLAGDDLHIGRAHAIHDGARAMIATPLVLDGEAIGGIAMWRSSATPFTARQIELAEIFASQAVIAIENVRLFKELQARNRELGESLKQQTATAGVLQVISASPTDVAPVFRAIVAAARDLGRAADASVMRFDGTRLHLVANTSEMKPVPEPWIPDRRSLSGRVILAGEVVEIPHLEEDPEYDQDHFAVAGASGATRCLGIPLVRDGAAVGVINVAWEGKGAVAPEYVRLLQTFADQAVIAMENVRLFNEIQEKSRLLEVAGKHKSEFLANMSHELRTPLNAIIGFSEVMLGGMAGPMAGQQKEFVGDIRDSGKHLLALINDILDLSKIEAGRMELDVARFDLRMAMNNAITLVRGRAERSGIRLDTEIGPGIDVYVGDERKFKQIVLNLLTNAVKFTPEGGRVTLGARRMNGSYVFDVIDTGVGIAPGDQQLIFEAFRQVGSDYERKAEGTGLGLALTRRLVQLHGGEIRVESAPGQGSTFTFTLPLETETA